MILKYGEINLTLIQWNIKVETCTMKQFCSVLCLVCFAGFLFRPSVVEFQQNSTFDKSHVHPILHDLIPRLIMLLNDQSK